jgi:hypothetical protein
MTVLLENSGLVFERAAIFLFKAAGRGTCDLHVVSFITEQD